MSVISRRRCDSCSKEVNADFIIEGAVLEENWLKIEITTYDIEDDGPNTETKDFCSNDCLKKWFRSGDRPWNQ